MPNKNVTDFAAKQKVLDDRKDVAITGITGDIRFFATKVEEQAALIKQLQDSPEGVWTPEDQSVLDQLDQTNVTLTEKLEALDASNTRQNPPPPAV